MTAHAPPVVPAETDPTISGLAKRPHQSLVATPAGYQFGAPRLSADHYRPNRTIATTFTGDATKATTGVAATGVFTAATHGYSIGDLLVFVLTAGGSGLTAGLPYYVNTVPSANTFTVALAPGGTTVTYATDLTSGTSSRKRDGFLFNLTNMAYTTSSGRVALRAADGGSGTYASIFTKEQGFRNWDVKLRYRPANDATTASTDYGPNIYGNWTDPNNNWQAQSYHNAGNPNWTVGAYNNGTLAGLNRSPVAVTSPLSTTQDRIVRIQKTGDLLRFKDWPTNTVEPGWQHEQRIRPNSGSVSTFAIDNPEYGSFGIYGQFMGSYFLDFTVTELVRVTDNLIHNADFRKWDMGAMADTPKNVSGVASTGVFTTTANHSLAVDDLVVFGGFNAQTNGIGIVAGRDYYVKTVPSATTFTVAASRGGTGITFSTDMSGGWVVRNPAPTWWYRGSPTNGALLTGNSLEIRHMAGPDGVSKPAICLVAATPNDPNLTWTQDIWNPLTTSGDGGFAARLAPHPQGIPTRRMEFSCWVKGAITAVQNGGFGITLDAYMYDAYVLSTLMTRQAYHPGLSPTTANDGGVDVASYDGAQTVVDFSDKWYHIVSIIECEQPEAIERVRCQILAHEATDTGYVYVMDPCLRPVG